MWGHKDGDGAFIWAKAGYIPQTSIHQIQLNQELSVSRPNPLQRELPPALNLDIYLKNIKY